MAEEPSLSVNVLGSNFNTTIGHDSIPQESSLEKSQVFQSTSSSKISIRQIGKLQNSTAQIGVSQVSIGQYSPFQVGGTQIGEAQISMPQVSSTQVGTLQIDRSQISTPEASPKETGITQVSINQISTIQIGTSQIDSTQVTSSQWNPLRFTHSQIDPSKITFSSSIPSQQFLSSNLPNHLNTSELTNVESTAVTIWNNLVNPTTPINLNFEITNLPTGQLAEATITGYDQLGRPNTATISIDDDANGVGWFIDPNPQDNSEFTGVDNYLQATPNSAASGKYDLLTAILHEMGHTLGFINGYSQFNQSIKGRQFYTDSTHSYTLSSDLSHLDNTLYPNDLLNTNLKPGIRKLPSTMDWAIINAISGTGGLGDWGTGGTVNPAHLTAGALIGITNGDFTTPTTWNTAGATNIINGTATLTEQSQKLSELTQAFIIPTGAKTLQFTIKDNNLVTGDTTKTANDAFEVALLDTNTFNPLAGTSIGLNHTDSLLNIQANGTIHKSDKVTITALGNNSSIVTIDLTQVTPSTNATLYFNLIGFGARTSTVTIDDVKLFTDTQPIPITKNIARSQIFDRAMYGRLICEVVGFRFALPNLRIYPLSPIPYPLFPKFV
jgi:large repetitive protein